MADPVEKLKRKMLEKLRDAGAPEIVSDAVDLLTPDDVTDLGMTAAAAMIPGGAVVKGISKTKKLTGMAAKIAQDKAAHRAAMRGLEKAGAEAARSAENTAVAAGIGTLPIMASEMDGSEADEKIKELIQKRRQKNLDKQEKKRTMVQGVRG